MSCLVRWLEKRCPVGAHHSELKSQITISPGQDRGSLYPVGSCIPRYTRETSEQRWQQPRNIKREREREERTLDQKGEHVERRN